ncbi:TIGR01440 family protein [Bacillus sp. 2205SS5-2]|uniref:TIGR01440 family protein n=1 Tax=Bacillus sp. 2205SS5-2 TaxID=3109031 RepID=UPI003005B9EA
MDNLIQNWRDELHSILQEYQEQANLKPGQIFVVGCSTSEVSGAKIGTAGATEVAVMLYDELNNFARKNDLQLAFQCCEHLNRALVVDRALAEKLDLAEVTVVPARTAGGAMATLAYERAQDAVVVEHIVAHGGIDIGDTFIGMHLKHVAVPIRVTKNQIGSAHVTLARTRPKLVGGIRAVYEKTVENEKCT